MLELTLHVFTCLLTAFILGVSSAHAWPIRRRLMFLEFPNVPAAGTLCGGRRHAASFRLAASRLCPPASTSFLLSRPTLWSVTSAPPWPGSSQSTCLVTCRPTSAPGKAACWASPVLTPRGHRSGLVCRSLSLRRSPPCLESCSLAPCSPHFTFSSFSKLQSHSLALRSREAPEWLRQKVPPTRHPLGLPPQPPQLSDLLGRRHHPSSASLLPASPAAPDPRLPVSPIQTAPPHALPCAVPSRDCAPQGKGAS